MKKRGIVLGITLISLLFWTWPAGTLPTPEEPTDAAASSKKARAAQRRATAWRPSFPDEPTPVMPAQDLEKVTIHVQLRDSPHLQQEVDVFHGFTPREFLPPVDLDLLPDSPTADALAAVLAPEQPDHERAVDDFLDAIDADPELEGFHQDWVDIIDLETERMLADQDYDDAEAEVMDLLSNANRRPHEEVLTMTANLPDNVRDNSEILAVAYEIIDDDPLHPMADIARLYAARGLSDYAAAWPNEALATDILLDTLANSETQEVQTQAIRMLVDMTPARLAQEDLEILEHCWYTLDAKDQGQLSRFLTEQHFARGDLARAETWTDRFEAEVLSGEMSLSVQDEFLDEVNHNRARIGARRGNTPQSWRVAMEQSAWQCWESSVGKDVTLRDASLEITGEWDEVWQLMAAPDTHPLADCMLAELEGAQGPDVPTRLRLSIKIFGTRQ